MAGLLVLAVLLALLGVCGGRGWVCESREHDFSAGRLGARPRADGERP